MMLLGRLLVLAWVGGVGVSVWAAEGVGAPAAGGSAEGIEFFEKHVRPLLVETCYKCHSEGAEKVKGGLFVDSREGLLKGGKAGAAVVPGDPEKSLLIKAVRYADEDLQMPPKEQLSREQVAILEAWVKMGAPDPRTGPAKRGELTVLSMADAKEFWSFKRPVASEVPKGWGGHPVDYFVAEKMKGTGLGMAAEADRRTLIRRATLDLTGLPPTAEEVAAFEADRSADAFEKVVERLLASPAYGQRWARHWLDLARYADTKGYVFQEERRYPYAYTYRDWVVDALNADMPYDQFLVHQIAGDRVVAKDPKADPRNLAAMGFLTLGRRFLNSQPDIIDDRLDVITRGTMGLTVACARCHDHKFDPIPTADYYSLYGVFASSVEPKADALPALAFKGDPAQLAAFEKELAVREGAVEAARKARWEKIVGPMKTAKGIEPYLLATHRAKASGDGEPARVAGDTKLSRGLLRRWRTFLDGSAMDPVMVAWHALTAIPEKDFAAKGPEVLKGLAGADPKVVKTLAENPPKSVAELAAAYAKILEGSATDAGSTIAKSAAFPGNVPLAEVESVFTTEDRNAVNEVKRKRDSLLSTHPGAPARAMVLADAPTPVTPVIFKRGNAGMPGAPVPRQFLEVIEGKGRKPFTEGSGRLELARAIASAENPLTARVFVNRVWARHFGQGLVRTPSDFGVRGERPTHPELLDYLAVRFVKEGWSVKRLHKLIMTSAAYRQGSEASAEAMKVDADNRLLSHQNRQRLDFEALRDSLLFAAGRLDASLGGKSVDLLAQPFTRRRTVYGFVDRQNLPNMFRSFDFASPDQHAPMRFANTVPQQALFMMNSPFVVEQAKGLAGRAGETASAEERIRGMYRAAFSREPSAEEIALGLEFVKAEPDAAVAEKEAGPVWQYGYGAYEEAGRRVVNFASLPHFTGAAYQGGKALPDGALGWCVLTPSGGHAGNDAAHAVVRRWTAPRDGAVTVSGTLGHGEAAGDGVRGRIVSSRAGELATLVVHNTSAQTRLESVEVRAGDTIDFVVDCRGDHTSDSFSWPVTVKMRNIPAGTAGGSDTTEWDTQKDFAGPRAKPVQASLGAWEKYAQVLLQTNEFVFVD